MKRAALLGLLALTCCRKKPPPPPPLPPPPVIVDAGPLPIPKGPPFTLHSRFPFDRMGELHPLSDGVAVVQMNDAAGFEVSTIRAGQPPVVLVPKRSWKAFEDTPGAMWGTTELLFVQLASGHVLRATTKGVVKLPHRYRHVIELRNGQWIGLRANAIEFENLDADPVQYELVAGTGSIPVVPSIVRPSSDAVRLSEGRICTRALSFTEESSFDSVWTADIEGRQHNARVDHLSSIVRGVDAECYGLTANAGKFEFLRINGDDVAERVTIHNERSTYLAIDREGGVWFMDPDRNPFRVSVENGKEVSVLYPLPATADGCAKPQARDITALGPNDVWVTADCLNDAGKDDRASPAVLFHTGPAGEVFAWPALK